MNDLRTITPKRDIARELARKYSTMTHDELDILEGILEPVKYGKGEMILAMSFGYAEKEGYPLPRKKDADVIEVRD